MGNCNCPKSNLLEKAQEREAKVTQDLMARLNDVTFESDRQGERQSNKRIDLLKSFKVVRKVGQGLFSKVYLATDAAGVKVAIKMISKEQFKTKEEIEKIIIEKEVMKRLNHRNVLKLFRTQQTNSKVFFIMEYAEMGNLDSILNRRLRFSVNEIRPIAAQIIEALLHIHSQGIIYGDLKLDNVLLNKQGLIKLCDFNLSGTPTILGDEVQGTINYLAPEIIDKHERTQKSDFWSLGVLLHFLFYRRMPFSGSNQIEFIFNITNGEVVPEPRDNKAPQAFRQLVLELLVKNPRRRLGNSLNDFVEHPFFAGFDWKNYTRNPVNFAFLKDLPELLNVDVDALSFSSSSSIDIFKESPTNNFHYNIENFTYESKVSANEHLSGLSRGNSRGSDVPDSSMNLKSPVK